MSATPALALLQREGVAHTVHSYERMGVSAILLEDQQWPKRCGHMVGKKVVPRELAVAKIKAACAERLNPETWILARTDARAVYDLDGHWVAGDGLNLRPVRVIEEDKGRLLAFPRG